MHRDTPKQWAAVTIVCVVMGLVARFLPVFFIPAIMILTIAVFQKHYYQLGLLQRTAYTDKIPSGFTKSRYQIFSILRCAWIGSIAGVLPIITVGGSYTERVNQRRLVLHRGAWPCDTAGPRMHVQQSHV